MTYSRRERIEFGVSVAILIVIVLIAPSPKHEVINGRDVAVVTIHGWRVPEWLQFAILAAILGMVRWVGRCLWPLKVVDMAGVERVHHGNGVTVGWIPETPGTPSPMDYQPWTPGPETTAEEYMQAEGPNPARAMILGEAWHLEYGEFVGAQYQWIRSAPEAELRKLIGICEELCRNASFHRCEELVLRVTPAYEERGIPEREQIQALLERIERDYGHKLPTVL